MLQLTYTSLEIQSSSKQLDFIVVNNDIDIVIE